MTHRHLAGHRLSAECGVSLIASTDLSARCRKPNRASGGLVLKLKLGGVGGMTHASSVMPLRSTEKLARQKSPTAAPVTVSVWMAPTMLVACDGGSNTTLFWRYCAFTNAVVAIEVSLSEVAGVGACGSPVKTGEAFGASADVSAAGPVGPIGPCGPTTLAHWVLLPSLYRI